MPKYIIDRTIKIKSGLEIFCRVTGDIHSIQDGHPFILDFHGGPGINCKMRADTFADQLELRAKQHGETPFHCIFFDYPNSGCSEKMDLAECSVDKLTEIAAEVAEAVQAELKIKKLNLILHGFEFGGLLALNLPKLKPHFMQEENSITVRCIYTLVSPINYADWLKPEIVQKLHANDPELPKYLKAIQRVHDADIRNINDYINNIVIPLAPLFVMDKNAISMGNFILSNRGVTLPFFRFVSKALAYVPLETLKMKKNDLDQIVHGVEETNLAMLGHFKLNRFNGINLANIIAANKSLYTVPICCVSGSLDCASPPELHAEKLQQVLPQTLATFCFKGQQLLTWDFFADTFNLLYAVCTGKLTLTDVKELEQKCVVERYKLPEQFLTQLKDLNKRFNEEPKLTPLRPCGS